MADQSNHGMVHLRSPHTFRKTLERLKDVLQARGLPIVAEVDHSGAAAKAGLSMRPTELLIFGNAKAGTPLMIVCPTLALDLPLKVLLAEDADGQVWLSYNSPDYLQQRHGIPAELMPLIAGIQRLAEETVR